MTADEAKQALKEGKRVRNKKFNFPDSFIELKTITVDEFGEPVIEDLYFGELYQNDEWEIVE